MTEPLDLDRLEALLSDHDLHDIAPGRRYVDISDATVDLYDEARTALPALIAEVRAARNYIALLEQAAGTMIQVERERRAVVFERSTVFSRPECVFKYCASPSDCQERCMLTKRGSEPSP